MKYFTNTLVEWIKKWRLVSSQCCTYAFFFNFIYIYIIYYMHIYICIYKYIYILIGYIIYIYIYIYIIYIFVYTYYLVTLNIFKSTEACYAEFHSKSQKKKNHKKKSKKKSQNKNIIQGNIQKQKIKQVFNNVSFWWRHLLLNFIFVLRHLSFPKKNFSCKPGLQEDDIFLL